MKSGKSGKMEVPCKRQVLVVEDHSCAQMALRMVINGEPDMEVCGIVTDVKPALAAVEKLQPDIVIVDLMLPNSHGFDLIRDLKIQYPHIPSLVHSAHTEELHAPLCLHAGARGYVNKGADVKVVVQAIRSVLAGEAHLSDRLRNSFLNKVLFQAESKPLHPLAVLSPRELQVFEMIGRGQHLQDIAIHLGINHKTIERHRLNIAEKLGLKSATEVLRAAILWIERLADTPDLAAA